MSEERQFFENLYNQRINFFIIVYSLIVVGTLAAVDPQVRIYVLFTGCVIIIMLALSLYRACHKLSLIIELLKRTKGHPIRRIDKLAHRYKWPLSFPANKITGICLPAFVVLFLLSWLLIMVINNLE